MKIAIRVDASSEIGSGHFMRCLALSSNLISNGAEILFISRDLPEPMIGMLNSFGVSYSPLGPGDNLSGGGLQHSRWLKTSQSNDAKQTLKALSGTYLDWIIVDHYALDSRWEVLMQSAAKKIMVIDDLADRFHQCNLLLDQNLGRRVEDYTGIIPEGAEKLIGPKYSLLRPSFAQVRSESLLRRVNPQFKHLLISMGGADKDNKTSYVLDVLNTSNLPAGLHITVVMGGQAPWLQQVRMKAMQMQCSTDVLVDVKDMAQLMALSDFAIGAAGGTSWERCCLGLPSIVLVVAENQQGVAAALKKNGGALVVNNIEEIKLAMERLLRPDMLIPFLRDMSLAAQQVTDGQGTERVVRKMLSVPGYYD